MTYCPYCLPQSSSSSCRLAQVSEERAGFGQSVGEEPEQSRTKRTESPSWIPSSDGDSGWVLKAASPWHLPDWLHQGCYLLGADEIKCALLITCFVDRSLQERLRLIRNNVVLLLTILVPQLDLSGIRMESPEVDAVLQQIIEANHMKQ